MGLHNKPGYECCPDCHDFFRLYGNGKCNNCRGSGKVDGGILIRGDIDCPECSGTGQCQTCGGTGEVKE